MRSAEIDINSFPEKEIEKVEEHRPNILTRPPKKGSGYGKKKPPTHYVYCQFVFENAKTKCALLRIS